MHLPEDRAARTRLVALTLVAVVGVALFATATVAGARMGEVMGVLARKGEAQIGANDRSEPGAP
jgi:hypothetical protein